MEAVKLKFIELDNIYKASQGVTTYNEVKGEEEYQPKLDILINSAGNIYTGDIDNTFP